jgi:hypothetical protein
MKHVLHVASAMIGKQIEMAEGDGLGKKAAINASIQIIHIPSL